MDRRGFILGTAGLALASLGDRARYAWAAEQNPSFDPSYDKLPTPEEQTKELDSDALAAQAKPRMVVATPISSIDDLDGEVH